MSFFTRGRSRRQFLREAALFGASASAVVRAAPSAASPFIQTVLGPIPATQLGLTLAHEHVICDFIGAEQTGRHRWQVPTVVNRMRPFLTALKERGVTGFIDCTPAYIGRDPRILRILAEETGLHLVTNTGYYGGAGDKYVPAHAYTETPSQLAGRWVAEWEKGIEGTDVKPGFIKTGVDKIKDEANGLSEIDGKLIRASAQASRRTGLSVVCHTGGGPAGLAATKLFIAENASPDRFIVAHSDKHGLAINQAVANLGAWVSFDAISRQPVTEHLALLEGMIEKHASRLLLSQDNGWFSVGQDNGGEIRDFNFLTDTFLPACRARGMSDQLLRSLTRDNPARAFAVSV